MNFGKNQPILDSPTSDGEILLPTTWNQSPTIISNGSMPSPSSPDVYNTITSIRSIRSANGTVLRRFVNHPVIFIYFLSNKISIVSIRLINFEKIHFNNVQEIIKKYKNFFFY